MKWNRIAALLVALMSLGVMGCMRRNDYPSDDAMVAYLADRYNDSFSYYGPGQRPQGHGNKRIYCTCSRFPGRLIWVDYDPDQNAFRENYLCIRYEQQTREYLVSALDGCLSGIPYGYLGGITEAGSSGENGSEDTTFEAFLSSPASCLEATVILCTTDHREELKTRVHEGLEARGLHLLALDLIFTDSNSYTGLVETEQFQKLIDNGEYVERCLIMDEE